METSSLDPLTAAGELAFGGEEPCCQDGLGGQYSPEEDAHVSDDLPGEPKGAKQVAGGVPESSSCGQDSAMRPWIKKGIGDCRQRRTMFFGGTTGRESCLHREERRYRVIDATSSETWRTEFREAPPLEPRVAGSSAAALTIALLGNAYPPRSARSVFHLRTSLPVYGGGKTRPSASRRHNGNSV